MQVKHFLILAAISALAICSSFFACSRQDQKPIGPPERITIAYAVPPFTALADIAFALGYFRQEGLDVTPHFLPTGKAALDEVLEGKADIATVAETPVMFAILNGQKISIIATIQSSSRTDAIFARRDKGILTPHELKGKRIATPFGTGGDFFTDAFLAANDISRQEVTLVNIKPDKMADALVKDDVDAASTWQPFLGRMQKMLGDKGITFYDEDIFIPTFNIVATQGHIRQNPAKIDKMLRALIRAEEFLAHNRAESLKIVAEFRKIDRTLLSEVWEVSTFSVTLDQSLLFALEDESRWAIKRGLTENTKIPNYLNYIYLDGLTSVKPKAVRIVR